MEDISPFVGPLIRQFWTYGDISSGFQSQSGQPYLCLAEVYMLHVSSDSHLVQHMPTSWWHGSQVVLFHIPVSRHYWGSKLGPMVPQLPVWHQAGRRSSNWAMPVRHVELLMNSDFHLNYFLIFSSPRVQTLMRGLSPAYLRFGGSPADWIVFSNEPVEVFEKSAGVAKVLHTFNSEWIHFSTKEWKNSFRWLVQMVIVKRCPQTRQ